MLPQNELAEVVEKALAKIFEQWQSAPDSFLSANIASEVAHSFLKERRKNWITPQPCLHPGCSKQSIFSHSIQKNGPLKLIADHGKLLKPFYDIFHGTMVLREIGADKASTFPGFCRDHDDAGFKKIENGKNLNSEDVFHLQTFRTICWKLRAIQHDTFRTTAALIGHDERFKREVIKRLKGMLSENFWRDNNLDGSSLSVNIRNGRIMQLRNRLSSLDDDYRIFYDQFYKPFCDPHGIKTEANTLTCFRIELPIVVPVCLADGFILKAESPQLSKRTKAVFNIQPHPSGTNLWVTVAKGDEADFRIYFESIRRSPLLALYGLNMIERFMTTGAIHWFIKPSVWKQIPRNRQSVICSKMLDSSNKVPNDKDLSIFDELRVSIIRELEPFRQKLEIEQVIKQEQEKIEMLGVY